MIEENCSCRRCKTKDTGNSRRIVLRNLGVAAAISALIFVGLPAYLGRPTALLVIEARTEILRYWVENPALSRFDATGFELISDADQQRRCLKGVIEPGSGNRVSYFGRDTHITVLIEPVADSVSEKPTAIYLPDLSGAARTPLDGTLLLRTSSNCPPAKTAPSLPVWGRGELGSEVAYGVRVRDYRLLEATLEVYSRSRPVWPIARGGELYEVARPIPIPPDALLVLDAAAPEEIQAAYRGYVFLSKGALDVSVSTEARELKVVFPSPYTDAAAQGKPVETLISVDRIAQLFKDPNILSLQGFIALLLVLFNLLGNGLALLFFRNNS